MDAERLKREAARLGFELVERGALYESPRASVVCGEEVFTRCPVVTLRLGNAPDVVFVYCESDGAKSSGMVSTRHALNRAEDMPAIRLRLAQILGQSIVIDICDALEQAINEAMGGAHDDSP